MHAKHSVCSTLCAAPYQYLIQQHSLLYVATVQSARSTLSALPGWQSLSRHCPLFDRAIAALAGTKTLSVCDTAQSYIRTQTACLVSVHTLAVWNSQRLTNV